MASGLEHVIEGALHPLPDAVPMGPDDHTPSHRRVVGELRTQDQLVVPLAEVISARGQLLIVTHGMGLFVSTSTMPTHTGHQGYAWSPPAHQPRAHGSTRPLRWHPPRWWQDCRPFERTPAAFPYAAHAAQIRPRDRPRADALPCVTLPLDTAGSRAPARSILPRQAPAPASDHGP